MSLGGVSSGDQLAIERTVANMRRVIPPIRKHCRAAAKTDFDNITAPKRQKFPRGLLSLNFTAKRNATQIRFTFYLRLSDKTKLLTAH